jgi:hypothetical protein
MESRTAAKLMIVIYLLGYVVVAVPLGVFLAGLEMGWW